MDKIIFKRALTASLPVMMGYLAMGFAAGVLLASGCGLKYPVFWGVLTSATSISGTLQFMLVDWFTKPVLFLDVILLTFCINIRYAMYGISLIERFRGIGFFKKFYLIWTLTDETYALEVENNVPEGRDPVKYCLTLAALNHSYWIIGVGAGALAGKALPFPNKGIDFAMTALFLVILTDQCREKANRIPALTGALCALVSFLIVGTPKNMLIPAMILMFTVFLLFRKKLEGKKA